MKTNVPIDLSDDQRSHLADLFDGKHSKRLATRREISLLMRDCIDCALQLTPGDVPPGVRLGAAITDDINRGGWSMVDQPPSPD